MQALTNAFKIIDQLTDESQAVDAVKAKVLMAGYHHRWHGQGYKTISTEAEFRLPIVNPSTGRASRTFQQGGKVDGVIEHEGRKYLLEHKTTSEEIGDPNCTFWSRLAIDSQISMYLLSSWQRCEKLDGVIYDVIKKPTTGLVQLVAGPMKLPNEKVTRERCLGTIRELKQFGSYYGIKQPETRIWDALEALDRGEKPRESAGMYSARLSSLVGKDPEKFFQRRLVPRLDGEIVDFARELWDVAKDIGTARKESRHYRNSDACMNWNTPCKYLGICSGHDTPDSSKWIKAPIHPELPSGGDTDVLTNSRIKTFQTCRRKHYYSYELGIEKVDQEERYALWFGSLMHEALRIWFDYYKGDDN